MIVAVIRRVKDFARTSNRSFEARGLRDDEVSGDSAIGPAADTELVWISNTLFQRVIHHRHVVLVVLVAPIGKDGLAEFLTVTGRAPGIGQEHGVAIGGEELRE